MKSTLKTVHCLLPIPTTRVFRATTVKEMQESFYFSADDVLAGLLREMAAPEEEHLRDRLLEYSFAGRAPAADQTDRELTNDEMERAHQEYELVINTVDTVIEVAQNNMHEYLDDIRQLGEIVAVEGFKRVAYDSYSFLVSYYPY